MLSYRASVAAKEIAISLGSRRIIGIDLEKHLKSSAGKYNLNFDNDNEYLEFEDIVFDSIEARKIKNQRVEVEQDIDEIEKESKKIKRIYIKNTITKKVYELMTYNEAQELTGVRQGHIAEYIEKCKKYKGIYLFSRTKNFIEKPVIGTNVRVKVKVTNIKTGDEEIFPSQSEAADFMGVLVQTVGQARRKKFIIKKTWKVNTVDEWIPTELSNKDTLIALSNEFKYKYSISELEALKMAEKELEKIRGNKYVTNCRTTK